MADPPLRRRRKPPTANAAPKAKPDKPAAKKKTAKKRAARKKAKTLTSPGASSPPSNKRTPRKKATRKKASRKKVHRAKKPTEPEEAGTEEAIGRKLADSRAHRGGRRKATASEASPLVRPKRLPRGNRVLDPFTDERQGTILKLVQDGAAQSYAAHIAGVSARTLQKWLRKGRKTREERDIWIERAMDGEPIEILNEDLGVCPEPDPYSEFAALYDKADAQSIVNVAQCILDRALARDGFVLGGTESQSEGQGGGSWSKSVRNGTIECAQWWLERKDNRMFGKGALRPREDDERAEDGRKVDPVADLLEHINRAFAQAPEEEVATTGKTIDEPIEGE